MILVAESPTQLFFLPSDQIALISHLQFARLSKKQDRIGMSAQNRRIERERRKGRRTARGGEKTKASNLAGEALSTRSLRRSPMVSFRLECDYDEATTASARAT